LKRHNEADLMMTPAKGRLRSSNDISRRIALGGATFAFAAAGADPALAAAKFVLADAGSAPNRKALPSPRAPTYEVLEVGPEKRFRSLTDAGCFMNSEIRWNNGYAGPDRIARMGFRLVISPGPKGYYTNDSGSHSRRWSKEVGWPPYEGNLLGPVIVEGEAGKPAPVLDTDGYGDGVLYYQTGLFATGSCDATFRHLVFRGFRRQDGIGNYAAVRLGQTFAKIPMSGHVLFEDCEISGCDNGIMGGTPGQTVTLRRCYIHDNGNETGKAHNIYLGDADELVVEDVLSTRCTIGHLLKSRTSKTSIRNSRLIGNGGAESAGLDVPDGGVLEIDTLVCEKSPGSDANWMIHYAGENQDNGNGVRFHLPSSINISNLTLVAPPGLARHPSWGAIIGFANQSGLGEAESGKGSHFVPPHAQNVQAWGLHSDKVGLPFRSLQSRPNLDTTSPVRG
jgi:hypothetical protein